MRFSDNPLKRDRSYQIVAAVVGIDPVVTENKNLSIPDGYWTVDSNGGISVFRQIRFIDHDTVDIKLSTDCLQGITGYRDNSFDAGLIR